MENDLTQYICSGRVVENAKGRLRTLGSSKQYTSVEVEDFFAKWYSLETVVLI